MIADEAVTGATVRNALKELPSGWVCDLRISSAVGVSIVENLRTWPRSFMASPGDRARCQAVPPGQSITAEAKWSGCSYRLSAVGPKTSTCMDPDLLRRVQDTNPSIRQHLSWPVLLIA